MSYWVLVLLAATAGALFGSLPRGAPRPWQRPHPVRGTISFALPLIGGVLLLAGHFMRWDESELGFAIVLGISCVLLLISAWLSPRARLLERFAITGFVALLVYLWIG